MRMNRSYHVQYIPLNAHCSTLSDGGLHLMSLIALLFIGLAMSADAFAAAIGKGVAIRSPGILQAFKIGLVFASVEVITPLVGWLIGRTALPYISAWDHWVAFLLLLGLGVNMIRQACFHQGANSDDGCDMALTENSAARFDMSLVLLAFATSIDALAMGVSLSLLSVSIVEAASVIGSCTLVMATTGVLVGNWLGRCGGRFVEVLGGLLLIGMGIHILLSHMG